MFQKKFLYFFLLLTSLITLNAFGEPSGAVYTMDNSAAGNHILVFNRSANGSLSSAGSFATNGTGTGTGLGNQGGLVLSDDEEWLLAVNAGSNEITLFRVRRNSLEFRNKISSGGKRPISVTIYNRLVYVLNAGGLVGGNDNISGFRINAKGELAPVAGSTRPLSSTSTDPAQIEFGAGGEILFVTEKATNIVDTYLVGSDDLASGPNSQASEGQTPFGFSIGKRHQLFVSEAFGGTPNASALSSYSITPAGDLQNISPSVGTTETAACWVVITNDGRFAYVTNTGSGTISGFKISFSGHLTLLDGNGITATTGAGPIDMAFAENSRFLYALNSGAGSISAFRVKADGSLVTLTGVTGLPAGGIGLAAR
jgi:6-phosphogluconolactonase